MSGLALATTTAATAALPNPDLDTRCGADLVLVLDASSSIRDAYPDSSTDENGAVDEVVAAADAFLSAFADTASQVAVVSYNRTAQLQLPLTPVTGASIAPGGAHSAALGDPGGEFGPLGATTGYAEHARTGSGTNWDAALLLAASVAAEGRDGVPTLVVHVTDGEPTFRGDGNGQPTDVGTTADHVAAAELSADDVKSTGAHITTVGVGSSDAAVANLVQVSGRDVADLDSGADFNISTTDVVLTSDFDRLSELMAHIGSELCGASLTVTQLTSTAGDPQNFQPTPDQPIVAQPMSPASSFAWTTPVAGEASTATGTTDGNGATQFQWDLDGRSGWSGPVQITETPLPGTTFVNAVCTVAGTDYGTQRDVVVDLAAGTVLVDVGLNEAVTCVLYNEAPAIAPAIALSKTVTAGDVESCPGSDDLRVVAGATVTYCFEVTNTGDTTLTNVTLSDPDLAVTLAHPGSLAPGEGVMLSTEAVASKDLVNTAEVTGTPANDAGEPYGVDVVSATDEASVDTLAGAIDVDETVSATGCDAAVEALLVGIEAGAPAPDVTWCIVVTNTGEADLADVEVVDPTIGLDESITLLAVGESETFEVTRTAADETGNAIATGWPVAADGVRANEQVEDQDPAEVDLVTADINISTTVSRDECEGVDLLTVSTATDVVWCHQVTNTGETDLADVVVSVPGFDGLSVGDLAPGERRTVSRPGVGDASEDRTGTVIGTPIVDGSPVPGLDQVTDDDPAELVVADAAIALDTLVAPAALECANAVDTLTIGPGQDIVWCLEVTNTGETSLSDVTLTDDVGGTTVNDGVLAPGESWLVQVDDASDVDLVDDASVVGTPSDSEGAPLGMADVTAEDPARVDVVTTDIDIDTTIAVGAAVDCAGLDLVVVGEGQEVTWCMKVTNSGETALAAAEIWVPELDLTLDVGDLAIGEMTALTITEPATGDLLITPEVTARPVDPDGDPVRGLIDPTDADPAELDVVAAAIELSTTVLPADLGPEACEGTELLIGGEGLDVLWCYKVTNIGDVDLHDVIVEDPVHGIVLGAGDLAPGEMAIVTHVAPLVDSEQHEATASGSALLDGEPVPGLADPSDSDPAGVERAVVALDIQKTVALPGDDACPGVEELTVGEQTPIVWCVTVTNTSTVALAEVSVTDETLDLVEEIGNLAPGEQRDLVFEDVAAANTTNIAVANGLPVNPDGTPVPGLEEIIVNDDAVVIAATTSVEVVKTVAPRSGDATRCPGVERLAAAEGYPVAWCFEVTNTGTAALADVTVIDQTLGIELTAEDTLGAGESITLTHPGAVDGDLVNTATVTGQPVDGAGASIPGLDAPSAQGSAEIIESESALSVDKTVIHGDANGDACLGDNRIVTVEDAAVTWCFTVTNTGANVLTNVQLADEALGMVEQLGTLAPGETVRLSQSDDAQALVNEAVATGFPVDIDGEALEVDPVRATDTAEVAVATAEVEVTKTVDRPRVEPGTQVAFTIETVAAGDLGVTDLVVDDGKCGGELFAQEKLGGDDDDVLEPGEIWRYRCNLEINADLVNTVTVTGYGATESGDPIPEAPVEATDDVEVTIVPRAKITSTAVGGSSVANPIRFGQGTAGGGLVRSQRPVAGSAGTLPRTGGQSTNLIYFGTGLTVLGWLAMTSSRWARDED